MVWQYIIKNLITEKCGNLNCNVDITTVKDTVENFLKLFASDNKKILNDANMYSGVHQICILSKTEESVLIGYRDPSGQLFEDKLLPMTLTNTYGEIIPAMCKPGENSKLMKLCLINKGIRIAKVRFQTEYDAPVKDPLDLLRLIKNTDYSLSIKSGCDETQTHIVFINPPGGGSHIHALYLKYSKM